MNNTGRPSADQLLRYFIHHPDAQDTAKGIVQWWLVEQEIRPSVAEVTEVLNRLVAQQFVIAQRSADGRTHFRLNAEKTEEILKQLSNDSHASSAAAHVARSQSRPKNQ